MGLNRNRLRQRASVERKSARPGGRYTIVDDGADAILHFGKHSGERVSDLAVDDDARGYLQWILEQDFPDELVDVIDSLLTDAGHDELEGAEYDSEELPF